MTNPSGLHATSCFARLRPKFLKLFTPRADKKTNDVRSFDVEVGHVVRLIEQRGARPPRFLLVAPIREFRPDRDGIRPGCGAPQHVHGISMLLQLGFEILRHHGHGVRVIAAP